MRHNKGFDVKLVQENNLYYLPATIMAPGHNQHLQVQQATDGMVAMIAPTTLAKTGPQQVLGGNNDYWACNNEGYLVRCHRNKRKALFVPQLNCPVPLEQSANYRRTIIRRPDGNNEDFTEQFQTMEKNKQKRVLQGQAWTGESWFRVNKTKETSPAQHQHKPAQHQHKPAKHQHKPPQRYTSGSLRQFNDDKHNSRSENASNLLFHTSGTQPRCLYHHSNPQQFRTLWLCHTMTITG